MPRDVRISEELPRDQIPPAADVEIDTFELKRAVSIPVPISWHKALELEAARLKKPMYQLCLAELKPFFKRLIKKHKGKR